MYFLKIPELGIPFSERWSIEDMREEQREGNRANMNKFDKNDESVQNIMKKAAESMQVAIRLIIVPYRIILGLKDG